MKANFTFRFRTLLLLVSVLTTCCTATNAQELKWATSSRNAAPAGGGLFVSSVMKDAAGNTYVAGQFEETADFDPGPAVLTLTSEGGEDIFIAKFTASKQLVFAKRIGSSGSDMCSGLALDDAANMYITGTFQNSVDFDPGPGTALRTTPVEGSGGYVAKFDASGNYSYANALTGEEGSGASGLALVADPGGNVYITGYFYQTVDFDAGPGIFELTTAGGSDIFVAKYDQNGNFQYSRALGGNSSDEGRGIAIDLAGNVYVTGYFLNEADFDPGPGVVPLASAGATEAFLAKYDASGNYAFAYRIGDASSQIGSDLHVDADGNIYLLGMFQGTIDLDFSAANALRTSNGMYDGFFAKYTSAGTLLFARTFGSSEFDFASAMSVDNAGNIYITGSIGGATDFDPGVGISQPSPFGDLDIYLAKYDASGDYLFASLIGGSGRETGNASFIDASGNITIAGYFEGTGDFDPTGDLVNLTAGAEVSNGFIAEYTSLGLYVNAISLGDINGNIYSETGRSVARDAEGNIYVAGTFQGTIDIDPGSGITNLISLGAGDAFFAKYDSSGNFVYARSFGGLSTESAYDVEVDAFGNIYVIGSFQGIVDFDPGLGIALRTALGGNDVFVAKFDASGELLFVNQLGGSGSETGYSLATDVQGNIYITGSFVNTADFDPTELGTATLTSAGSADIFIAKYTSAGDYVYAKRIGGTSNDIGYSIYVDGTGNTYVAGYYRNTADFDPGDGVVSRTSNGNADIFALKLDATGAFQYVYTIGGSSADVAYGITSDADGNTFVTGSFQRTVDFDAGEGTASITSSGSTDIFLLKYDAAGNYLFAKAMGGTAEDVGNAIALDASGSIFVTGYFTETADFNASAEATAFFTSSGWSDAFVLKYKAGGDYEYAITMGGTGLDIGYGIVTNGSNYLTATGSFERAADFEPGPGITQLTSLNSADVFLAHFGDISPLPVTLTRFDATVIDKSSVRLSWATTAEVNNSYFEIERRQDGRAFEPVGRITGCGTCSVGGKYTLDDLNPFRGTSYYRLKQVDLDGRFVYSSVRVVNIDEQQAALRILRNPTPAQSTLEVTGISREQRVTVNVTDMNGSTVIRFTTRLAAGTNRISLDMGSRTPGAYLVTLLHENGKPFLKARLLKQ